MTLPSKNASRVHRYLLFILLAAATLPALAQDLSPSDLAQGGYVLYFRHAEAEVGTDCKDASQFEWWKSRDPEKTRQLTEAGKRQAVVIGQAFRKLDLPVDKVHSSEFRRAYETARGFSLGEVVQDENLTPLSQLGPLEERLLPLLQTPPAPGKNTVLVAHGHVLPMFENLEEGDAVVFRPGSDPLIQGTISFLEWEKASGLLLFENASPRDSFIFADGTLIVRTWTGIGRVKVSPVSGEWPRWEKVRFEYSNGGGVKVLEGLEITTDRTSPQRRYFALDPFPRDGALELPLPYQLPQAATFVELHWVDFYR